MSLVIDHAMPRDGTGRRHGVERVPHLPRVARQTGEARDLEIEGLSSHEARASVLDESSFAACTADPAGFDATETRVSARRLTLAPYAVCRLRMDS